MVAKICRPGRTREIGLPEHGVKLGGLTSDVLPGVRGVELGDDGLLDHGLEAIKELEREGGGLCMGRGQIETEG